MRRFLALVRKELSGVFMSPQILFATAFIALLDSFAFYLAMSRDGVRLAVIDDIAQFMIFSSIMLYPVVSMQSFSEENRSGALETLLTAPVRHSSAVLAKFLACMTFALVRLVQLLVFAVLLSYGGDLDWRCTIAAFLAHFGFAAAAMAVGLCVSALTTAPVAAAAGSCGFLLLLALAADLDPYSGLAADILHNASFLPHVRRWIGGQIDTRGFIHFASVTAMFLFYSWLILRGRQRDKHTITPVVRRRLTATYLLVALAAATFLAQAAILHIHGIWVGGTPLGGNLDRIAWQWLIPFYLGLAALAWAGLTFRAARRAARAHRSGGHRYATITDTQIMRAPRYYYNDNLRARRRGFVAAFAALVVVFCLNWLAHYPFHTFDRTSGLAFLSILRERRWDASQDGRNTLSRATIRALDTLQGRLRVYCFLPDDLRVDDVPVAHAMRQLLENYHDYTQLVSVEFADAEREPALARRLAANLNLTPEALAGQVVLEYQGRRLAIRATALAAGAERRRKGRRPGSGEPGSEHAFFDGEGRITQGILHLIDPRVPTVYLTYGHLELSPTTGGMPARSMSRLTRALTSANMRVRQHSLLQAGGIPPQCDLLIVAAPRLPFRTAEVEEINRYLDRGGRLLFFAPTAGPEVAPAGSPLNTFLHSVGGSYRDDALEDWVHNDGHPGIVEGIAWGGVGAARPVLPSSRSMRANPMAAAQGWHIEWVVESHSTAVSVDRLSGERQPGPFVVGYRSKRATPTGEARVATSGSGRMASDADIGRGDNEEMLVAVAQWLVGRAESRGIPARVWVDRRISLTGAELRAVLWIGVVALPLAWLLAGVSAWWIRRTDG